MNDEDEKLIRRLEDWIDVTEREMKYLRKAIAEIKEKRKKKR